MCSITLHGFVISVVLILTFANVCCASALPGGSSGRGNETTERNKLLLILLDGFRWDYADRQIDELKGFPRIFREGSRAKWVKPIFPTESYPAWTSLVTGLHAESHNILCNYMFDKERNTYFLLSDHASNKQQYWWSQSAEPIWTTATKNKLRAADLKWSRCEITYNGVLPEYCDGYTAVTGVGPLRDHLEKSINFFLDGYDLVLAYGEFIDNIGHEFGPDSKEVYQGVRDYDKVIDDLLNTVDQKNLTDKLNIVIVSDHGMTAVGQAANTKVIKITDHISLDDVKLLIDEGAHMGIIPAEGKLEKVYSELKMIEGVNIYKKEEIPERYHYKHNVRVADIFAVSNIGYFLKGVDDPRKQIPELEKDRVITPGIHGYDPDEIDMLSICFGIGPDFKRGYTHDAIDMVDIYELYSRLLRIPANQRNGSWDNVRGMLKSGAVPLRVQSAATILSVATLVYLLQTIV